MGAEHPNFVSLATDEEYPPEQMIERSASFRDEMFRRRTVRQFSERSIPREVIENCILTAGSAPSGANLQPWHFVVVSEPAIRAQIRAAAEKEEHAFYDGRAPQEWLDALALLGTDENKPYLERVPVLIAVFAKIFEQLADGRQIKNYYVTESVGIATGMLITAVHHAGLVALTHTPSPMGFLNQVLNRPKHERGFLLLVVGYPADNAAVPNIGRKALNQITTVLE
jgi:iodotyrosine deiodinase